MTTEKVKRDPRLPPDGLISIDEVSGFVADGLQLTLWVRATGREGAMGAWKAVGFYPNARDAAQGALRRAEVTAGGVRNLHEFTALMDKRAAAVSMALAGK